MNKHIIPQSFNFKLPPNGIESALSFGAKENCINTMTKNSKLSSLFIFGGFNPTEISTKPRYLDIVKANENTNKNYVSHVVSQLINGQPHIVAAKLNNNHKSDRFKEQQDPQLKASNLKRRSNTNLVIGTAMSKVNNFAAASKKHSYHTSKWSLKVNINSVKEYIGKFSKIFEIVELSTQRLNRPFRSFKITIESNHDPKFRNADYWPAGVQISKWWQAKDPRTTVSESAEETRTITSRISNISNPYNVVSTETTSLIDHRPVVHFENQDQGPFENYNQYEFNEIDENQQHDNDISIVLSDSISSIY